MYDLEEYESFLQELKESQDRGSFYCMHNRDLAGEFFKEFKSTHNNAGMYIYDTTQFITENFQDRGYVYKYLTKRKAELLAEVKEIEAVMLRVRADGIV
jgi:hypothetical protein